MKDVCRECGKEFEKRASLQKHLVMVHKISGAPIVALWREMNPDGRDVCLFCGGPAQFISLDKGYKKVCADKVCIKKSNSPNTVEYEVKVNGLSENEAAHVLAERSRDQRAKAVDTMAVAAAEDPAYVRKQSRYCKEFWMEKGMSEEDAKAKAHDVIAKNRQKCAQLRRDDPDRFAGTLTSQKEYYTKMGFTEEAAEAMQSARQTTFSRELCIEKYGEVEGIKKWQGRQELWFKNYKKSNFSKVSQKLFWSIYKNLSDTREIYFATLKDGSEDLSGHNNEYVLRLDGSIIKPDFIDLHTGRIIEFDGLYYHNPETTNNKLRTEQRDLAILSAGFELLHVKEMEYYKSPALVVDKCIKFLTK